MNSCHYTIEPFTLGRTPSTTTMVTFIIPRGDTRDLFTPANSIGFIQFNNPTTFFTFNNITPLEPVCWCWLLTFGTRCHVEGFNFVSASGLDLLESGIEFVHINVNCFHPGDECGQRIDVYPDDLAIKAKAFNDSNATTAKGVKNNAPWIGVVLNKCPEHAPGPPGKITVHLVDRRMGLSYHRMVDRFQIVQIL
ncbi:MAG: hypothetical protein WBC05_22855 [Sedimentisphaerales bacterium]